MRSDNPEFHVKLLFLLGTVLLISLMLSLGCGEDQRIDSAYLRADVTRGGMLYDKWWTVTGANEPVGTHPLYPSAGAQSGSSTWRCKECHGWDYQGAAGAYGSGSHFTGIAGLWTASSESPERIFEELTGDIPAHDLRDQMGEDDIWDLVRFIKEGVVNVPQYIDRPTKTFIGGDAESGESVYLNHCAPCHGVDGAAIDFHEGEFVNDIASGNPWEFLHKVRMGQPGTAMTALFDVAGITMQDVANLGAYAQSLIPSPSGNVTRGGRLYDKWWSEAGVPAPAGEHPLYPAAGAQSGSSTWRCKECHGWDYLGADGAYGSGSHFTGIVGVWQAAEKSREDLYATLGGGLADHDFSPFLSEQDLWDLADFLTQGTAFIPMYIDAENRTFKNSDAGAGGATFDSHCAICHGSDGTGIDFGDGTFINDIASGNPWEFLHKARMGQPSTAMTALFDIPGMSIQDAANVGAYAQNLEPSVVQGNVTRGGRLYDKWWVEAAVSAPSMNHPLYPAEGSQSGSTTWRCKECHGWDYQGADGAYGGGSHFTGFGGVFTASSYESTTLMGILSGNLANHDFSAFLDEDDLTDLVAFLSNGVVNIPDYIDLSTKTFKNANPANGESIYAPNCALCHGVDGQQIDFGDGTFIYDIATGNPWEFLHKARMGQPGTFMTALYDNPTLYTQDASDVGAYAQTLE